MYPQEYYAPNVSKFSIDFIISVYQCSMLTFQISCSMEIQDIHLYKVAKILEADIITRDILNLVLERKSFTNWIILYVFFVVFIIVN